MANHYDQETGESFAVLHRIGGEKTVYVPSVGVEVKLTKDQAIRLAEDALSYTGYEVTKKNQ